jgi:dephospho-CoA kinase
MILGFTGKNAAGKTECCNYLASKGFVQCSLSDIIRDGLSMEGKEPARENMIKKGNELREKYGPNYLAAQMAKKISESKNKSFAIDSIRSPHEANELKKIKGFRLIGIDADPKIRFERMLKRDRVGDAKTFERFQEDEKKENLKNDAGQQLDKTFAMSDEVIRNEGTLQELHNKINGLVR